MKVKDLISLLNRIEPELELYTLYDHGVVHKLTRSQVVLVDHESNDKLVPQGLYFCSHHDDDMEFLKKHRNYKSIV